MQDGAGGGESVSTETPITLSELTATEGQILAEAGVPLNLIVRYGNRWERDIQARLEAVYRERDEALASARQAKDKHAQWALEVGTATGEFVAELQATIERLRGELQESDQLRERMSRLLTETAAALKGEPPPLVLHDWSDLPAVAVALRAKVAEEISDALLSQRDRLGARVSFTPRGEGRQSGLEEAAEIARRLGKRPEEQS